VQVCPALSRFDQPTAPQAGPSVLAVPLRPQEYIAPEADKVYLRILSLELRDGLAHFLFVQRSHNDPARRQVAGDLPHHLRANHAPAAEDEKGFVGHYLDRGAISTLSSPAKRPPSPSVRAANTRLGAKYG